MKVVWTRVAQRDLIHLHGYILEHDPAAAKRMAAAILDAVATLTRFPALGRPGRVPGTRELVIADTPFLVPYRIAGGRLEIVAVLHGAQRWPPS